MTFYYKIVHRGTLPSGEVFAHSHRVSASESITVADMTTAVAAGRAAIFTSTFLGNYHTSTAWTGADIYRVELESDHTIEQGTTNVLYQGTVTGSTVLPTEVAMVLTLRTINLTRRGRGRMYLPSPAVSTVDGSGLWTSTIRTTVVNGWKAYFEAVNSADIVVAVRGMDLPPLTTHAYRAITSIDVGSVPDAQRRRRDSIAETRTSATITP